MKRFWSSRWPQLAAVGATSPRLHMLVVATSRLRLSFCMSKNNMERIPTETGLFVKERDTETDDVLSSKPPDSIGKNSHLSLTECLCCWSSAASIIHLMF